MALAGEAAVDLPVLRPRGGEDGDETDDSAAPREEGGGGWSGFSTGKTVSATLFKLNPLPPEDRQRVEQYVRGGAMLQDFVYARELCGLVQPGRGFSYFWESPILEDVEQEVGRKRRIDEQQRNNATRSYMRAASTQHDADDVDKYIESVNRLIKWEKKRDDSKEVLRTISNTVQIFEKRAVRAVLAHPLVSGRAAAGGLFGMDMTFPRAASHLQQLAEGMSDSMGVAVICDTLRRCQGCYDAFAGLVAAEILVSEARSTNKNTTIHISKTVSLDRTACVLDLLEALEGVRVLRRDTVGLPLIRMKHSLCVSNGVLVVCGDADTHATYILNVQFDGGALDLAGVETIRITGTFSEDEMLRHESRKRATQRDKNEEQRPGKPRSSKNLPIAALA